MSIIKCESFTFSFYIHIILKHKRECDYYNLKNITEILILIVEIKNYTLIWKRMNLT